MRKVILAPLLVGFGVLAGGLRQAPASPVPTITEEVQTEFGTYSPYLVDVKPAVRPYTVQADFGNVANFDRFEFSPTEQALLLENGFFAAKSPYKQLYDVYKDLKEEGAPIFVTTDAMLHTFHVLYDNMLRILEVRRFADDLDALNHAMLAEMDRMYSQVSDPTIKELLRRNVAYLSVATLLNDPDASTPAYVQDLVNAEMALIDAHEGIVLSPIFGYEEDYSQYVPRGHYTRNNVLKHYFRSMMWHGRMRFRIQPGTAPELIAKGKEETLQAIYLVWALSGLTVNAEPALAVWDRIYAPTVFFVGKADDLTIYDYIALAEQVYGANWRDLPLEALAEDASLTAFIEAAKTLHSPLIASTGEHKETTKGFRFMGQRFIPDSYMFQELVLDKVEDRLFPKGLDVLAVLGSEHAYSLLDTLYHETSYPRYIEQMAMLKAEFAQMDPEVWAQNLYWNWLYVLMPLLYPKGEGYPPFMQSPAWMDKELATALGSWAELRHDTILYAKQSYTWVTGESNVQLNQGYVEPNPHLYARLAALAAFMRNGLDARNLLIDEVRDKLEGLQSLLLDLKTISEKELTYERITYEEYELVASIGDWMEGLVTFSEVVSGEIESETDDEMAVVADVHTDPNTQQVLEEGVGYPLNLCVIANVEGRLVVSQGAMFSYFEFPHPMSDRLTDEAWQHMLKSPSPPSLPVWTGSYVADIADIMVPDACHSEADAGVTSVLELEVTARVVRPGEVVEILGTLPGYVEARSGEMRVALSRQGEDPVWVPMAVCEDCARPNTYKGSVETQGWADGEVAVEAVWQTDYRTYETRRSLLVDSGSAVQEEPPSCPEAFALSQNVPNPFNPATTIRFTLPQSAARVTLAVYNLRGQRVRTLADGPMSAGTHALSWSGCDDLQQDVASGVYFCRLSTNDGGYAQTRRMVLMR